MLYRLGGCTRTSPCQRYTHSKATTDEPAETTTSRTVLAFLVGTLHAYGSEPRVKRAQDESAYRNPPPALSSRALPRSRSGQAV